MARRCERCHLEYAPRARTQRFCEECRWVEVPCERCGRATRRARATHERRPYQFCTTRCRLSRGGLYFNHVLGRWLIIGRDGSLTYYYRAVMAAHLGRELVPEEIVHHVNGDSADDRIENLQLTTRAGHMAEHRDEIMAARWAA